MTIRLDNKPIQAYLDATTRLKSTVVELCPPINKLVPLTPEQVFRRNQLVKSDRVFKLKPKHGKSIEFTAQQLLIFLSNALMDAETLEKPPFITGGAACHVLTNFEFFDIDITFLVTSSPNLPLKLVQKFLAWKLGHIPCDPSNPHIPPENLTQYELSEVLIKDLNDNYIFKKILIKDFSYIGLGEFDLKFQLPSHTRSHVSTSDSFYISIVEDVTFSQEEDFEKALEDLKHRTMFVKDPSNVRNLIFRILHKMTQGFEIQNQDLTDLALKQMCQEYPSNNLKSINEFYKRFRDHLMNHFKEDDETGKMVAFLNLISLLNKIENKDTRQIFLKTVIAVWKGVSKSMKQFITLLEKNLDDAEDLLAIIQGIFLLEWINQNDDVSAYNFNFIKRKDAPRFYFSLKKSNYLAIPGHPGCIAENFLKSWRRLEEKYKNENPFRALAEDTGLSTLMLTRQHRPIILKTLLTRYSQPPINSILAAQFSGNISPTAFCKSIEHEIECLKKEGCAVLSFPYITSQLLRTQLEFSLKQLKDLRQPTKHIQLLIEHFKAPLKRPPATLFLELSFPKDEKNETLRKLLDLSVIELLKNVKHDLSISMIDSLQKFLQDQCKFSHAEILLDEWLSVISSIPPEGLLSIYKFTHKLKKWQNFTSEFEKKLKHFQNKISRQMLQAAEKLAEKDMESAFYCLSAFLNDPNCEKNAQLRALCLKLANQALKLKTGLPLRLAVTVLDQLLKQTDFSDEECHTSLKIISELQWLHLLDTEKNQSKEFYTKIAYQHLDTLLKKRSNVDTLRTFLINWMSGILTSNNSNTTIQKQLKEFRKRIPEDFFDNSLLDQIQELISSKYAKALKDFISFVSHYNKSLASEMLSKPAFHKFLQKDDLHTITWDFIGKAESEEAYELWKRTSQENQNNFTIYQINITLKLMRSLQLREPSDFRIVHMIECISNSLKNTHNGFSNTLSTEEESLRSLLSEFLNNLIDASNVESLRNAENLYLIACEGSLISKQLQSDFNQQMIKGYLKIKKLPPEHIVHNYFDTHEKLILLEISPLVKKCISEKADTLLWYSMNMLSGKCQWDKELDNLFSEVLKAVLNKQLSLNLPFVSSLLQNDILNNLSQENRSSLLEILVLQNEQILCGKLWKAIHNIKLPNAVLFHHCLAFLKGLNEDPNKSWIDVIKKSVITKTFLVDETSSFVFRGLFTTGICNFVKSLYEKENNPRTRQEFIQFLNSQWNEISHLLPEAPKQFLLEALFNLSLNSLSEPNLQIASNLIPSAPQSKQLEMVTEVLTKYLTLPANKISDELVITIGNALAKALPTNLKPSEQLQKALTALLNQSHTQYSNVIREALHVLIKNPHRLREHEWDSVTRFLLEQYLSTSLPNIFHNCCRMLVESYYPPYINMLTLSKIIDKINEFATQLDLIQEVVLALINKFTPIILAHDNSRDSDSLWLSKIQALSKQNGEKLIPIIFGSLLGYFKSRRIQELPFVDYTDKRVELANSDFDVVLALIVHLHQHQMNNFQKYDLEFFTKDHLNPEEYKQYSAYVQKQLLIPLNETVKVAHDGKSIKNICDQFVYLLPLYAIHNKELGKQILSNIFQTVASPPYPYHPLIVKIIQIAGAYNFFSTRNEPLDPITFETFKNFIIAQCCNRMHEEYALSLVYFGCLLDRIDFSKDSTELRYLHDVGLMLFYHCLLISMKKKNNVSYEHYLKFFFDKCLQVRQRLLEKGVPLETFKKIMVAFFRKILMSSIHIQTIITFMSQALTTKLKSINTPLKNINLDRLRTETSQAFDKMQKESLLSYKVDDNPIDAWSDLDTYILDSLVMISLSLPQSHFFLDTPDTFFSTLRSNLINLISDLLEKDLIGTPLDPKFTVKELLTVAKGSIGFAIPNLPNEIQDNIAQFLVDIDGQLDPTKASIKIPTQTRNDISIDAMYYKMVTTLQCQTASSPKKHSLPKTTKKNIIINL